MNIREITPGYSVAPQITPDDVARIAELGFRAIMCNRPDGEAADQPAEAEIRAAAAAHGLDFAFVPVISGCVVPEDVDAFRAALAELPAPVLAYCRSGARCHFLWQLAH